MSQSRLTNFFHTFSLRRPSFAFVTAYVHVASCHFLSQRQLSDLHFLLVDSDPEAWCIFYFYVLTCIQNTHAVLIISLRHVAYSFFFELVRRAMTAPAEGTFHVSRIDERRAAEDGIVAHHVWRYDLQGSTNEEMTFLTNIPTLFQNKSCVAR